MGKNTSPRFSIKDGEETVFETDEAVVVDDPVRRAIGLMGQLTFPDKFVFIMNFPSVGVREIHSAFVFTKFDVLWVVNGEIIHREEFTPFTSLSSHEADQVIEVPSGCLPDEDITGGTIELEDK